MSVIFPQRFDIVCNGFRAGLVAITCPCYWVSPFGAIMIGGIAGVVG
jgi:ammonia channel protein AmtB